MRDIISVTGKIAPEAMGFCQCHEDIALSKGESFRVNPALCIDDFEKSLQEVTRYRESGGNTLVEAQPVGCNRIADWLHDISGQTGVTILASTGFHKMMFYPEDHWIHTISEEALADLFTEELTEGMYLDGDGVDRPKQQSNYRAGLIKTAYDTEALSKRYLRLFHAAAKAALKTDRVMMIHVENKTNPVLLLRQLLDWGVRADQLMFCHMDRACADPDLHREIAKSGAFLEYDTIGRFKYHDDNTEAEIFGRMIDEGYEDQLLYSLDTTGERLKSYSEGAIGLDYILRVFNGILLQKGISEQTVRKISRDNPRRLFSGEA